LRAVLVGAVSSGLIASCSQSPPPAATRPSGAPHEMTSQDADTPMIPRRRSCRDRRDDVLGYLGTGDAGGPGPEPPSEDRTGTDIRSASIERARDGMTLTMTMHDRIPTELERPARLLVSFTGSTFGTIRYAAAVVARRNSHGWSVEMHEDANDSSGSIPGAKTVRPLSIRPTVAGRRFELVLDDEDVPRLMRGAFRWGSRTTWIPLPAQDASDFYDDWCPERQAPFRGSS
jgi:hypothetical protein